MSRFQDYLRQYVFTRTSAASTAETAASRVWNLGCTIRKLEHEDYNLESELNIKGLGFKIHNLRV
jgi:hypothetical protein